MRVTQVEWLFALKLAADHTYTVIDGPPHAESIARSCIVASDLVHCSERSLDLLQVGGDTGGAAAATATRADVRLRFFRDKDSLVVCVENLYGLRRTAYKRQRMGSPKTAA